MDDKNIKTLVKIVGFADKILAYGKGRTQNDFVGNNMLVEACVFNMIQMGEAIRVLDVDFMDKHGKIPWHKIRGLRNRIVHNYDGVEVLLIWDIINYDLQDLVRKLRVIINNRTTC